MGRTTKRSIIGGDLNLPYEDWNSHVEKSRGTRVFLNRLVWENGCTQKIARSEGMLCLAFILTGPKVCSPLKVMFRDQ